MKTIKFLTFILIAAINLNACQVDDDLEFVAQPQGDFEFTNTFLEQYVLSPENNTNDNIGVLFVWESVNFDAPTTISYQIQNSLLGDFSDATNVGSATSENQKTLSIGELKTLASDAGYTAPAEGVLHFRVRAFVGESASTVESFSSVKTINILLPEASGGSGIQPSTWGIVGNGYNDWGAFADAPFYTTNTNGVLVSYVTLVDGEIKFRENNNWDSNLGDNDANGSLEPGGANILVTAGNYKITLNLNDNTYTMEDFSWGIVGSAYNDWGATPDAKFYYDYTTDNFKVSLRLQTGEFKVRFNNAWGGDLGDSDNDGILDTNPDNNIPVTEGHYTITFNPNDNSYSIVEDEVWGIVGSGYNNWGESPDFSLTKLGESLYVGDIATIIDGELKFRKNNNWGGDLGDANNDGILDADPDNNIAVTAGLYRIVYDSSSGAYAFNKVQ